VISERAMRAVLVVLGVLQVASGALALVAPVLAFGVAVLVAAQRPSWRVPVLALGAIWYGLHALNHAFDVDEARSDARGIVDTIYIGIGALLFVYLAWAAVRLHALAAASPDRKEDPS
jgi:hypothetical protein